VSQLELVVDIWYSGLLAADSHWQVDAFISHILTLGIFGADFVHSGCPKCRPTISVKEAVTPTRENHTTNLFIEPTAGTDTTLFNASSPTPVSRYP